jgi:hypothetical protein
MDEEQKNSDRHSSPDTSLQSELLDRNSTVLEPDVSDENRPLNKEEIDYAYELINDKYPLNYLSIFEVLSLHRCFKR